MRLNRDFTVRSRGIAIRPESISWPWPTQEPESAPTQATEEAPPAADL